MLDIARVGANYCKDGLALNWPNKARNGSDLRLSVAGGVMIRSILYHLSQAPTIRGELRAIQSNRFGIEAPTFAPNPVLLPAVAARESSARTVESSSDHSHSHGNLDRGVEPHSAG